MVKDLTSSDPVVQLLALVAFRRLLSIENDPPIQAVIAAQVVPRFVEFLQSESPKLQLEAAWTLTNIVSGSSEETRAVVDAGAVPILVQLLRSPHENVRGQVIWALGNIAADGTELRDAVLSLGAMSLLLDNCADLSREWLVRNAMWTLSNFCRGKPLPVAASVERALPALQRFLASSEDVEVLRAVCSAFRCLVDVPVAERHPQLLDGPLLRRVAALNVHEDVDLRREATDLTRSFVKWQATMICCALHELALPAPLLIEIVEAAFEFLNVELPFHFHWNVVVAVKHLQRTG